MVSSTHVGRAYRSVSVGLWIEDFDQVVKFAIKLDLSNSEYCRRLLALALRNKSLLDATADDKRWQDA